jgi:citrate lyase beta subunit
MIELNSILKQFINDNLVGIKQSFEDEGVLLDDVISMRRFTELNNLKLNVKIGGCEALTDIHNCKSIGVSGIVAPMIETEFALQKFIESVIGIDNIDFYINIESKSGYENLDRILKSPASKLLKGIVVGRSDLTKSYGYDKNLVDSDFVFTIVKDIMKKSKKY